MDLLGKKLRQQKELREKAKKPRKKQEYTPVEIDTGLDDENGGFENDPLPDEEPVIRVKSADKPKNKPLPLPPTKKLHHPERSGPSPEVSPKRAGPSPPAKPKPGMSHKPPPASDSGRNQPGVAKKSKGAPSGVGMALMQELAQRGKKSPSSHPKKASPSPQRTKTSPQISPSTALPPPETDNTSESEPLYANTAEVPKQSTPAMEDDFHYQNCEFDGPPPPPTAAPGNPSPPTLNKNPTGGPSEYQNFNFITQKQPSPGGPTKKKKGPPSSGQRRPLNASPRVQSSPHVMNGSSEQGPGGGVYQNYKFKGNK